MNRSLVRHRPARSADGGAKLRTLHEQHQRSPRPQRPCGPGTSQDRGPWVGLMVVVVVISSPCAAELLGTHRRGGARNGNPRPALDSPHGAIRSLRAPNVTRQSDFSPLWGWAPESRSGLWPASSWHTLNAPPTRQPQRRSPPMLGSTSHPSNPRESPAISRRQVPQAGRRRVRQSFGSSGKSRRRLDWGWSGGHWWWRGHLDFRSADVAARSLGSGDPTLVGGDSCRSARLAA
jgi:hypothetical protein